MASIWTIGDIHGEAARLDALLSQLPRRPGDTTVFLGDYIDRGPDSAGVVKRVLAEYDSAPARTVLLWGNHEDMAAAYFRLPYPSRLRYSAYDWLRNGGREALASYGLTERTTEDTPCPPPLERLFGLLRTFWRSDDPRLKSHIWVHAGVPPGVRPEDTAAAELLWIRDEFLNGRDVSGRVVVHGHTVFPRVRVQTDKIGIDTGAAMGGLLTALQLPEQRVYQADRQGRVISTTLPEPSRS